MAKYKRTKPDMKGAYAFYTKELDDKIELLETAISNTITARKGIYLILSRYIPEIRLRHALGLTNYKSFIGKQYDTSNLEYLIRDFESEDGFANKYIVIRYIRQIVKYNIRLVNLRSQLTTNNHFRVPPVLFNLIVSQLFLKISDKIANGKKFIFGNRIGTITAYRRKVEPTITLDGDYTYKINFGATRKKKAELIDSGVKESDLWNGEKYNAVVDELIRNGSTLIDAKFNAKHDSRCGIPYAVFCNEEFNYWIKFMREKHYKLRAVKKYIFIPAQDFLRRFQRYAKSLDRPEIVYELFENATKTKA